MADADGKVEKADMRTWTQTWTVSKYTFTFTHKLFLSYLMLFLQQYSLSNSGNCGYTFTISTGAKDRLAHYRIP